MKWGLLLVVVALFAALSCSKEKMAANKLEGYWDVTKCTFDGDNMLDEMTMTFLFLEYSDGEGDAVWTWDSKEGLRGMGFIFTGEYALNKEGDEIAMDLEFDPEFSVEFEGDIDLTKGEFELEGVMTSSESSENIDIRIKAEKHE